MNDIYFRPPGHADILSALPHRPMLGDLVILDFGRYRVEHVRWIEADLGGHLLAVLTEEKT